MRSAILREISSKSLNPKEAHVVDKHGLTPKKRQSSQAQQDATDVNEPVATVATVELVIRDETPVVSPVIEEQIIDEMTSDTPVTKDDKAANSQESFEVTPSIPQVEEITSVPLAEDKKKKSFFKKKTQTEPGSSIS